MKQYLKKLNYTSKFGASLCLLLPIIRSIDKHTSIFLITTDYQTDTASNDTPYTPTLKSSKQSSRKLNCLKKNIDRGCSFHHD